MNIKECKQKVKEFVSRHKKKLIVASAVGAGAVGGFVVYKLCKCQKGDYISVITDTPIGAVLSDAFQRYPDGGVMGFNDRNDHYTCDQLGEFGEMLKREDPDLASRVIFTELIAIGTDKKSKS